MSSDDGDSTPRAKTAAEILLGMKLLKDEEFAESNFAPQNRARTGRPMSKNNLSPPIPAFLNSNLDPGRLHLDTPLELSEWWTNYTKINESKYGNLPQVNFKLEDDLLSGGTGSKRPKRSTRSLFASEDPGFQLDFPHSRFTAPSLQTSQLRFGLTDLPIPKLLAKHLANDKDFSKYSYSSGNQSDSEVSETYGKGKGTKGGGTRKRNIAERDFNREISTSRFRGVSKHRMTGKWEVAVWFNGKQQYLGGFEDEEKAARAYDLATLAVKGEAAVTNFPLDQYSTELDQLRGAKPDEVIAYIRRNSCCFTRGRSKFRGVSGQDGHWEARIGNFMNRKNASLGVYKSQEDAARMYDRALLIKKGPKANTNFPVKQYKDEVIAYLHQLHLNGELESYLATDGPNAGLEDIKPSQIRAQHLVHVFLAQINTQQTFPGVELEL